MKKEILISKAKYLFATSILTIFNFYNAFAKADVKAGLEDAHQQIRGLWDIFSDLCLVISAIVGLIGAIQVYSKFSSGDPDGGKRIGKWVGALVFMGLCPTIIEGLFM